MDCREAKEIIPAYLANAATAAEVGQIESHLAVCQDCRAHLGKMIDEPVDVVVAKPSARAASPQPAPVPMPTPEVKAPVKEKMKAKNSDNQLTPLDYGALIVGILVLGFLLSLFIKK